MITVTLQVTASQLMAIGELMAATMTENESSPKIIVEEPVKVPDAADIFVEEPCIYALAPYVSL